MELDGGEGPQANGVVWLAREKGRRGLAGRPWPNPVVGGHWDGSGQGEVLQEVGWLGPLLIWVGVGRSGAGLVGEGGGERVRSCGLMGVVGVHWEQGWMGRRAAGG